MEERKHDVVGKEAAAEPRKIWQEFSKLTVILNFINKDTAVNQLMIKAFEEVYRRNSTKLRILIQQTRLQEAAHDPVVCVVDTQSKAMLSQTFNFIDVLGGKSLINADNICKFLAVRGVFEPSGSDIELITRRGKEAEIHNYVTRVAQCAGEGFEFDHVKLAELNNVVEEMDKVDIIEVDAATYRYQEEIIDVCRSISDPFANQLGEMSFEPNPTDMSKLTKTVQFACEHADGQADAPAEAK